ncbi:hypothetical protein LTR85_004660 [Meristemomyces frigidus]|nr:hypothetical protein LTR85_004660 [Meristemomyces frigidus]
MPSDLLYFDIDGELRNPPCQIVESTDTSASEDGDSEEESDEEDEEDEEALLEQERREERLALAEYAEEVRSLAF